MAVGHPEGVGGGTEAAQFRENRRPPAAGVFQLLQHDHPRSLAEHEAVTAQVERPRRLLRVLIIG